MKDFSIYDERISFGLGGMNYDELKSAGITLVGMVPFPSEEADEARRHGIKTLPYVSFYKVVNSDEDKSHKEDPFWKEIDCPEHPEWIMLDKDGSYRRPFDDPNYPVGIYQSCTNSEGLKEAYLKGIKNLMELGAEGIFVDNMHPNEKCWGMDLNKHRHLHPERNNIEGYISVLEEVCRLVKRYGEHKIILLNTGRWRKQYAFPGDCVLWESYICSWAWNKREDWKITRQSIDDWKDYLSKGKAVLPISYLGFTPYGEEEDSFYTFGCAKVSGYLWTSSAFSRPDVLRILYRSNLGRPRSPLREDKGIFFRVYENGMVGVNPNGNEGFFSLAVNDASISDIVDLYAVHPVKDESGRYIFKIPGNSGRVFLNKTSCSNNFLQEIVSSAREIKKRGRELQPQLPASLVVDIADNFIRVLKNDSKESSCSKPEIEKDLGELYYLTARLRRLTANLPRDYQLNYRLENIERYLTKAYLLFPDISPDKEIEKKAFQEIDGTLRSQGGGE